MTLILENGFWSKIERDQYRSSARDLGIKVELYYLNFSLEKLWERLSNRNKNLRPGTFKVSLGELKEWYKLFEAPDQEELDSYDSSKEYK